MTHNPPPDVPANLAEPTSDQANSNKSVTTEQDVKSDDVYNYNCALLADGLFFMNFLDATVEGDGARMMRQYKYLLLYCRADGASSTKYALEFVGREEIRAPLKMPAGEANSFPAVCRV